MAPSELPPESDDIYGFTRLLHATGELYLAIVRKMVRAIQAGSEQDYVESTAKAREVAECFEWQRTMLTTHATRHLFEDSGSE